MQKKIIKVTTLREMGAEMGVEGQEQNFTLCLFVLFLIFEPDEYITTKKKFKSIENKKLKQHSLK